MTDRVTIHHEGAGAPDDDFGFLVKKYSIGIGRTRYDIRRSPADSFVTVGQGGVHSLQICFSGDRSAFPLTDNDLDLLEAAVADARARGWVTDSPEVFLHGDTMATACPGTNVRSRRAEVTYACQLHTEDDMPLNDADKEWILAALRAEGASGARDAAVSNVDDAVIKRIEPRLAAIESRLAAVGAIPVNLFAEKVADKLAERLKD